MLVPEATVHKYSDPFAQKDDVWASRQLGDVNSDPKA
jgi:hypothetical protein